MNKLTEEYKKLSPTEKHEVYDEIRTVHSELCKQEEDERKKNFLAKMQEFIDKWNLDGLMISYVERMEMDDDDEGDGGWDEDDFEGYSDNGSSISDQVDFAHRKHWTWNYDIKDEDLEELFKDFPYSLELDDKEAEWMDDGEVRATYMVKGGELRDTNEFYDDEEDDDDY